MVSDSPTVGIGLGKNYSSAISTCKIGYNFLIFLLLEYTYTCMSTWSLSR